MASMKYIDWQNSNRFRAMTGYDVREFDDLFSYFEEAHDEYLSFYYPNGKPRRGIRSHVIYSNSPLPCKKDRLAFILSYLKLNPIQEQHADMFSMTQKQCNEFVHCLNEILKRALKLASVVPANDNQGLQAILSNESFVDHRLLLHDGTEREIPRPAGEDLQKDRYSGKKKRHTVKNAVITAAFCLIIFVSKTYSGRIHDKTIADEAYTIPPGYTLVQDSGYQGYNPEGVKIVQPQKKPKGKELTQQEKENNRQISSFRVRIEHAIGGVKRYRIVKDECRVRKNDFLDDIFLYCAALHNFRLKTRPFAYENNLT
jgi:hypothetical protein